MLNTKTSREVKLPTKSEPQAMGIESTTLTDSLDKITHAAQQQLGAITQSAFFLGDGLQRTMVDEIFKLFHPRTWMPSNLLRTAFELANQSLQASRGWITSEARSRTVQEITNKLEVFILVKNLPSILNLPDGVALPLPVLVEKAYATSPFSALWAVEGVGHYYADIFWNQNGVPTGLLHESNADVPPKSLLMLHAGMGLAFADRLLGTLTSDFSASQVRSVVQQFIELCHRNSRPGYVGAAIESLGLVTRDFYPQMLTAVDQQVQLVAPSLSAYFWHGVGRALYFSRQYFLPVLGTSWNGIKIEAQTPDDRKNAIAGLAWAITLVNMRQPTIMEGVLETYIEDRNITEPFINGLASSIMMRSDTTPNEPFVSEFYRHNVNHKDKRLAAKWQQDVLQPATQALQHQYPRLKRENHLDHIFRFENAGNYNFKNQ